MNPPGPPRDGDGPPTNPNLRGTRRGIPQTRRMLLVALPGAKISDRPYEINILATSGQVGLSGTVSRQTETGAWEPVTARDPDLRVGRQLAEIDSGTSNPSGPRRWRVVDVQIKNDAVVFDFIEVR